MLLCFFVLLLVLLLGAVLQYPRELDIIKESALNWRLSVHLVDVLLCDMEFSRNECLTGHTQHAQNGFD